VRLTKYQVTNKRVIYLCVWLRRADAISVENL